MATMVKTKEQTTMNIKTLASLTMIIAALMATWGCSSSDDDKEINEEQKPQTGYVKTPVETAPDWRIDWSWNDPAPDWQSPDATNFESWAVLMVKLDSYLAEYADEKDMMAVFIDNELRASSLPSKNLSGQIREDDGSVYFILKVFSNNLSGRTVTFTLKYYSTNLHQMFSLEGQEKFVAERVYGVDEDFEAPFRLGASKYPIVTDLELTTHFTEESGTRPSANDVIGVFVGDECRGLFTLSDVLSSTPATIQVFCRQEGETATLRYYSAEQKSVFTFTDSFKLSDGNKTLSINI